DFYKFTVDGLGGIASFDITPATNGPNLDILAKLYNSTGAVIATSNPVHALDAGGNSVITDPGGSWVEGGWLDTSGNLLVDTDGDPLTDFALAAGTYYISVEGTGKPIDLSNA